MRLAKVDKIFTMLAIAVCLVALAYGPPGELRGIAVGVLGMLALLLLLDNE